MASSSSCPCPDAGFDHVAPAPADACLWPSADDSASYVPLGILGPHFSFHPAATDPLCMSPSKPRYSDRFIPARTGNSWHLTYPASPTPHSPGPLPQTPQKRPRGEEEKVPERLTVYSRLLMNEVLDYQHEDTDTKKSTPNRRLFNFDTTERFSVLMGKPLCSPSLSPISQKSEELLRSPITPKRKLSHIPLRVLDAPELKDDFYLNLMDWSSRNVLSVGLGSCAYMWSASTAKVTKLCDVSQFRTRTRPDSVMSVAWNEKGSLLAIGTEKGEVQVWDAAVGKPVTIFREHALNVLPSERERQRVGVVAWNGELLFSGSRDKTIRQRDIREPPKTSTRELLGHTQEVCGLKWSPDNECLASGGNDNRLYVWNLHSTKPIQKYTEHVAAVKAIAWSPHQHGLLASGGGTADRHIRLWNTLTEKPMQCIDTGSQVCNLGWSKLSSELVSTHGYSNNCVLFWKCPSLELADKLPTGHVSRVLHFAMPPDGETIVTGSGDETLRFWSVFKKAKIRKDIRSPLNLHCSIR